MLKRKMFVTIVSRGRSVKRIGCNKFGVATQNIPVMTRTRLLHQNFVATLSKSIAIKSKKGLQNQVATQNKKQLQKPATKT